MEHRLALAIARLRSVWDQEVGPSARRALAALVLGVLFAGAHVARIGTPAMRGVVAGALLLVSLLLIGRVLLARRRRHDPRHVIEKTVGKTDRALGAATLRAMTLVERTEQDTNQGSPELAQLHLSRLLGRASSERIADRALAAAKRWSAAGIGFALVGVIAVAVEPFRVVEGLDVLVARDGEAPLGLTWLEDVHMVSDPPDYLHQRDEPLLPFSATEQPRGSTITVRGRPVKTGRRLVLSDGASEVPFVDDGAGGLIARWTLGESADLFVAARFGAVRVRQPDVQEVGSIPDEPPKVKLEGAPRSLRILDEPSIPIHFEATDDHGLREVHLVLRSGPREERRSLSRPQADAKVDRGGYELRANDSFFKRTYLPVEVTVQARDNDPIAGPKWGKSEPIVVVLPQVGEPEALRYAALLRARDAVTDLLADRTLPVDKDKDKSAGSHEKREAAAQAKAAAVVGESLGGVYGGLRVRGVTAAVIRGQLRRVTKALEAERRSPGAALGHQKLLEATEDALLAVDAAVRARGNSDTRAVAKRLADVADEAAAAAALFSSVSERQAATVRLDAAVTVLDGGGKQMLALGELGLDLGEIVHNDLRRIARARQAENMHHAELAARDLAARLRRPEPSFSGGGSGGVESGPGPSAPPDPNDASEAEQEMQAGQRELEQLARDHADEIDEVARALEKAGSQEELDALREEAKKHAEAIREAVKGLPPPGADPGSAEAAAAAGREQAEAMAGSLERGHPQDAQQSGKSAMRALSEAKRLGEQSGGFFPEERAGRESSRAAETVERELAWLEDAMARLRRAAQERAKGELGKSGEDEQRLAERAEKLGKRGQEGEASMPEEMLERLEEAERAMRDAERSLKEGEGDRGLEQQQRAQRALEMAQNQEQEDGERESKRDGDGQSPATKDTEIPDKNKHKGPEQFRKRVMDGLGGASDPALKKAVKRYAEGLLR
jgi:hypothetical protein